MDSATLNTISLCSGVGMLDEGVHAGLEYLGIRSRTVMFAEREAYPVSILAARMEEGSLAPAPIWFGDFTELPARRFRGLVDGVVAGFPCQDLSVAGRRAGLNGKRSGLFFNVLDIADQSGAWFLVLENVAGIVSATASVVDKEEGELEERAVARVMGELADRGWDAEWITLSASDVGASHGRARWFCFAWRMDDSDSTGAQRSRRAQSGFGTGCEELADAGLQHDDVQQRGTWAEHQGGGKSLDDAQLSEPRAQRVGGTGCIQGNDGGRSEKDRGAGIANQALGDTESIRVGSWCMSLGSESQQPINSTASMHMANTDRAGQRAIRECECCSLDTASLDNTMADTSGARLPQRIGRGGLCERTYESDSGPNPELYCRALFAPGPADSRWPGLLSRFPWLAPAIGDEAAESLLRGMANGLAPILDFSYRAARLRAGGNGVVPACAGLAIVILLRRSGLLKG